MQAHVAIPTMLQVGAFSSISGGKLDGVTIGRYCAVAPDVVIGAHEHPTDWLTVSRVAYYPVVYGWDRFCRPDAIEFIRENRHPFSGSRPVTTIGHDVWIGQGAFIKAGVTLGNGCIVAARSVVTKDVSPYAVVAGTPAKVIRKRFAEPIIERLQRLQWWQYSLYDCFQVPFERIEDAIEQLEQMTATDTLKPYTPSIFSAKDLSDFCSNAVGEMRYAKA